MAAVVAIAMAAVVAVNIPEASTVAPLAVVNVPQTSRTTRLRRRLMLRHGGQFGHVGPGLPLGWLCWGRWWMMTRPRGHRLGGVLAKAAAVGRRTVQGTTVVVVGVAAQGREGLRVAVLQAVVLALVVRAVHAGSAGFHRRR